MAQKRLKSESLGWAPPTLSSEHALDLQRPESSDTLRGPGAEVFWFPLVYLVIFSGKSRPKVSSKGVGSGHPELAPMACDLYVQRAPQSEGTPPLLSLS